MKKKIGTSKLKKYQGDIDASTVINKAANAVGSIPVVGPGIRRAAGAAASGAKKIIGQAARKISNELPASAKREMREDIREVAKRVPSSMIKGAKAIKSAIGLKKGGSVGKPKMKMGGSCGTPKSLSKKK